MTLHTTGHLPITITENGDVVALMSASGRVYGSQERWDMVYTIDLDTGEVTLRSFLNLLLPGESLLPSLLRWRIPWPTTWMSGGWVFTPLRRRGRWASRGAVTGPLPYGVAIYARRRIVGWWMKFTRRVAAW